MPEFIDCEPGTSLPEITKAEKQIGVAFPKPYVSHLLEHNGGSPEPGTFQYAEGRNKRRSTVAWFFSVGPSKDENLLKNHKTFVGRIPADTVAIARDPGGNLILLGTAGAKRGRIFFWKREGEAPEGEPATEENVYPVADSLDEFLKALQPV